MRFIRYPDKQPAAKPTAVAVGNFDGVHRGHAAVIAAMRRAAGEQSLVPAVLTFEPHPRLFFAPHTPPFRIEPVGGKLRALQALGVQEVYAPRFDKDFAALGADAFLNRVLKEQLRAKVVVTGENFAFGKGREGNIETLRAWGAKEGIAIITVPAVMGDGEVSSSTAVRAALAAGDMARASALLGRAYAIEGRVVRGLQKGRTLGFPTANIHLAPGVKLPHYGVYAVRVQGAGKAARGVANLGIKPTLGSKQPTFEVHLFDFNGELYGRKLRVELVEKIRDEKKFDSLAQLTHQIAEDCLAAKNILEGSA